MSFSEGIAISTSYQLFNNPSPYPLPLKGKGGVFSERGFAPLTTLFPLSFSRRGGLRG